MALCASWSRQTCGPKWTPPNNTRLRSMPWAWPMRCTWAMKSAACMPVYPPNWLTWLLVASTSSGRCLDWANNKDARSTWGWAEHTDGVQATPALRLRRLISRRYCMAAFLSLRVESRRATMTTARTPPLSPHCAPARHGQAWVAWWPGRPGPQAQTTGADDWVCGAERHRTPCHRGPWATAQCAATRRTTAKATYATCRTIIDELMIESGVILRVGSKYSHCTDLGCSLYLQM